MAESCGTIVVEPVKEPNYTLRCSLGSQEITEPDSATVTAKVGNTGTGEGTTTVALLVDGQEVENQSVTVQAGAESQASFAVSPTAGDHTISVELLDGSTATSTCGTLTVLPPFDPSLVAISDCSIQPTDVTVGNQITVTAQVANDHQTVAVTAEVLLLVSGSEATSTSLTLDPESGAPVEFEYTPESTGSFDVGVDLRNKSRA